MTIQDIFNKVTVHLLTQRVRSKLPSGTCAYRGENNTSCAVGCLIKDEAYSKDFENRMQHHPAVETALLQSGVSLDDHVRPLLAELQNIHDSENPEHWERELARCAKNFNLSMVGSEKYAKTLTNS